MRGSLMWVERQSVPAGGNRGCGIAGSRTDRTQRRCRFRAGWLSRRGSSQSSNRLAWFSGFGIGIAQPDQNCRTARLRLRQYREIGRRLIEPA
jgi:hypothetical protein